MPPYGWKIKVARKLPDQLRLNPLMGEMLSGLSETVAEKAKAIAPVDTGDYRDGIEPDTRISSKRGGWRGRVNAHDFKSLWIEFGTGEPGRTPTFAPLRRALEAAGLTIGTIRRRRS